ncbi:Ca2+ calmodulin-dependent kinase [Lecanosticta acicola]|uniref:Ca2+ calmodulin-dependent kinase n=1 Tax=Lecanosticta acicola TaxID=111012 RepID=A0AAI8Z7X2_9PEZI|nr:Ca2+ calmodulin-dependent kinase [Lecanosticta acicola]
MAQQSLRSQLQNLANDYEQLQDQYHRTRTDLQDLAAHHAELQDDCERSGSDLAEMREEEDARAALAAIRNHDVIYMLAERNTERDDKKYWRKRYEEELKKTVRMEEKVKAMYKELQKHENLNHTKLDSMENATLANSRPRRSPKPIKRLINEQDDSRQTKKQKLEPPPKSVKPSRSKTKTTRKAAKTDPFQQHDNNGARHDEDEEMETRDSGSEKQQQSARSKDPAEEDEQVEGEESNASHANADGNKQSASPEQPSNDEADEGQDLDEQPLNAVGDVSGQNDAEMSSPDGLGITTRRDQEMTVLPAAIKHPGAQEAAPPGVPASDKAQSQVEENQALDGSENLLVSQGNQGQEQLRDPTQRNLPRASTFSPPSLSLPAQKPSRRFSDISRSVQPKHAQQRPSAGSVQQDLVQTPAISRDPRLSAPYLGSSLGNRRQSPTVPAGRSGKAPEQSLSDPHSRSRQTAAQVGQKELAQENFSQEHQSLSTPLVPNANPQSPPQPQPQPQPQPNVSLQANQPPTSQPRHPTDEQKKFAMLNQLQQMGNHLSGRADIDASTMQHFKQIHMEAETLAPSFAFEVPGIQAGMPPAHYVLRVLRPRLSEAFKQMCAAEWGDAIRNMEMNWGRNAADKVRRQFDEMKSAAGAPGGTLKQPDVAILSVEWEIARNRITAMKPVSHIRKWFEELEALAKKARDEIGHFPHPPHWPAGMNCEQFCKSLENKIYEERKAFYDRQFWNVANDAAKRELQPEAEGYQKLLEALRRGLPGWKPNESPAAEEFPTRARNFGFRGDEAGIGGHWQLLAPVGITENAHAGLWVQFDSSLNITNRMVVKESYMSDALWNHPTMWLGNVTDRLPMEFEMANRLQQCEQADDIVQHLGYGIYHTARMYRLYEEFCPHATLEQLIRAHRAMRDAGDDRPFTETGTHVERHIPTRALWATFEALAAALCLMKNGGLPGLDCKKNWDRIHHLDIKPCNVFLAKADPDLWQGIATAKLGDYGIAHPFSLEQRGLSWYNSGTQIYMAPEQHGIIDASRPGKQFIPLSTADVFGVGRVMLCLMNLHSQTEAQPFQIDSLPAVVDFEEHAARYYPQTLKELVQACLKRNVQTRIKVEDLWQRIHEQVTTFRGIRGPMKMEKPGEGEVLLFQQDVYLKWVALS